MPDSGSLLALAGPKIPRFKGAKMKRSLGALLTAAAVVGCQSPGMPVAGRGQSAGGVAQSQAAPPKGQPMPGKAAANPKAPSDIVQVGYNHGHGQMQNRAFSQRIAQAAPSHGGQLPNGMSLPGPMPPPQVGAIPLGPRFTTGRTQVRFARPTGMKIAWQSPAVKDLDGFTPPQLEAPARYNFAQARIYRLKLTDIANRPGLDLYPTLEVYPGNAKVDAYLAHNAVPVEFTEEDFDQVQGGNFVTKVIYLPDPAYQELAIAGVETLVSTRLDPGIDPVQEANRRGSILLVIRLGGVDLEMPHSPSLFPAPAMEMMPPPTGMMPQIPAAPTPPSPAMSAVPDVAPAIVPTKP